MQILDIEVMEYMVWLVELVSENFFNGNKADAYKALKKYGIWDIYVESYETSHTLGASYIMQEVGKMLESKGVI